MSETIHSCHNNKKQVEASCVFSISVSHSIFFFNFYFKMNIRNFILVIEDLCVEQDLLKKKKASWI